jgi:hypothetical protein
MRVEQRMPSGRLVKGVAVLTIACELNSGHMHVMETVLIGGEVINSCRWPSRSVRLSASRHLTIVSVTVPFSVSNDRMPRQNMG